MITDSYSNVGMLQGTNEFRRQQQEIDRERVLSMFPTDSTSPTIEGSLSTFSGIASDFGCLSEEELRSDSAYIAYYYSNANLNPRLPPPLQRLQGAGATNAVALGGIGDNRKFNQDDKGADHKSLFSMQLGVDVEDGDIGTEDEKEWGRDGLIGLRGLGLGIQQKIVDEMIQATYPQYIIFLDLEEIGQKGFTSTAQCHACCTSSFFFLLTSFKGLWAYCSETSLEYRVHILMQRSKAHLHSKNQHIRLSIFCFCFGCIIVTKYQP
ncbi:hypothetical protein RDI58_014870 [Solanum bulbocastanum]|uniref:Uncharacterized protein n=1 Tax=Solanum bulbocastanum TaxID=147425 RepID=A0AAN8TFU2_SOLBU